MPTSPPLTSAEVAEIIVRRDPAFGPVIKRLGYVALPRSAPVATRFPHLVASITHQLLATKAAATIHSRVVHLCGGDVCVESVLATGVNGLREAGISRTKAQAMVHLAEHVADGRVRLGAHGRMSDVDVTRELTVVPGIGPWTAHMYLMFTLARRDVWPSGDLGVRRGWSVAHGLDEMVTERELRDAGESFEGVRSAVAHYCWAVADQ